MSNIGSTSGQHGDNAALPQFSRKRSSPNSGSLKSETSSATSVAAVGSSSSKLRRITHSSVEQNPEGNDLSRQQTSHLLGALETGSVSGGSGRSGPSRSGHDSVRSELKYLTDFFPDQNPSDRRLTRSQRQYSIPVSTSQTADSIDNSAHTNSGSVVVEQSRSVKDRPRARKSRTTVAGRVNIGAESSRTANNSEQQPSTSSSARTRAHNSATGLCHSIASCESTSNRVSPTFIHQNEPNVCRSAAQLGVVVQNTTDDATPSIVTASNNNSALTTPVNSNAVITTTTAELSRTVNGGVSAESHSSQFKNLQRSQAVHTASSFLGALVPRVQHLLGSAHAHPSCLDVAIRKQLSDFLRSRNLLLENAHDFSGFVITGRVNLRKFNTLFLYKEICVTFEHLDLDILIQNMRTKGLRQDFIQPVSAGKIAFEIAFNILLYESNIVLLVLTNLNSRTLDWVISYK
uniref:Bm7901 n=1 Tax=Brugia malayi TaxID=6279 RepID=A0A0H5RZI0_BRUMA|nr:Bm7901 [Brugia malayi]